LSASTFASVDSGMPTSSLIWRNVQPLRRRSRWINPPSVLPL
jgi:hypothetical protein